MACSTSGDSVVPQAFSSSSTCASDVKPIIVLTTYHLV